MAVELIGWDIGGAHLKAAAVDPSGRILAVAQEACPLWQGMDRLHAACDRVMGRLSPQADCRHAVTMTGELVDLFSGREEGVMALAGAAMERFGLGKILVFAGHQGFIAAEAVGPEHAGAIASANWLASGLWTADQLPEALLVDVGSTTTDILPICEHRVKTRGYSDYERMRYDELVYTGIVRTPLMAVAERAPLDGEWTTLMAEIFATTADVYRLTGELPEHADQMPAADNGPKTPEGSARRLARLFGRDAESAPIETWRRAAGFLRERQLARIGEALAIQLSLGWLSDAAPLVGAGVGRFLVSELAGRLRRPYLDFSELFPMATSDHDFLAADCAPAAALAGLASQGVSAQ
jgi:probable H4MPT-linked C1 transfer pathway protein